MIPRLAYPPPFCTHPRPALGVPTSNGTVYTYCPDCGAVKVGGEQWHSCAECRIK